MVPSNFAEKEYPEILQLSNAKKTTEETEDDFRKRKSLLYRRRSYFKKCKLKEIKAAKEPHVSPPPVVARAYNRTIDNDIQGQIATLGRQYFKSKNIEKWSVAFLKGKFVRVAVVTEVVNRESPLYLSEKGSKGDLFDLTKGRTEDKSGLVAEVNRVFLVQVYEPGKRNLWSDLFKIQLSNVGNRPGLRNKAGYGLYAARPLKASETIGWYLGHTRRVKDFKVKPPGATEYVIRFQAEDGVKYLVDAGRTPHPKLDQRRPVYFGIHFANDPNYGKRKEKRARNDLRYNAMIMHRNLEVIALQDIDMGEEILLDYEGDACSDDNDDE